jgi:hypothetical protein
MGTIQQNNCQGTWKYKATIPNYLYTTVLSQTLSFNGQQIETLVIMLPKEKNSQGIRLGR